MKINDRNNEGERVNALLVIFTAGKKYEYKSKKALHSKGPCKKTFSVHSATTPLYHQTRLSIRRRT